LTAAIVHGTLRITGDLGEVMMRGRVIQAILGIVIAATMLADGGGTAAKAANIFELNFWMSGPRYDHDVPLCTERGPLDTIVSRFTSKEYAFWNSELEIVGFDNIREIAWEPWSSGTIPRRFCTASVMVSDGKRRQINYSINENGGLLGVGYGVEWCVVGLDRDWAYNPRCLRAKP
jgi:hypothetical protein